MAETIRVEVAYADPQRQVLLAVAVATGSTVADAIAASGILAQLPGFVPAGIGIFGQRVGPDTRLRDGDRVEIYRPLRIDPKQARRNRWRGQLP
jgi:putative ubiquitin-RnfH superfamily antitoxin RatB of RatAB toxin-antitoxin module